MLTTIRQLQLVEGRFRKRDKLVTIEGLMYADRPGP